MNADIHFLSITAAPVLPTAGSCDPTGGALLPCAAGELVDQRASYRDADGARCGGEITVHGGSYGRCGAATSSGKADDISAEGNQ